MQVNCPQCKSLIHSDDMNLDNMVGKCCSCNSLVSLKEFLPASAQPAARPAPRQRPPVPMPKGFVVEDSGSGLKITRRWFALTFIFLAFFCVAWDSFLIFWYSVAFAGDTPWIMKVFPIGHLAVGVGLTYFTLAGFLNRTIIRVENDELTILHGPLPWYGNWRIPVSDLDQLFSQQQTNNSKNGVSFSYKVNAVTKEGRKITLLSELNEQDQALFVEQQLENYLGIKDRPVPGELPR